MKKSIWIVLTVLLAFNFLAGFDYLWPVKVSRNLSATFGEYRPGHYHAGIDIKTNHSIGYPVYAIEDGYVWRIKESYRGYGKALYLQLKDGNFAVFAHLDSFAEKIEQYAEQEQKKAARYKINKYFPPDKIPVKKGEVIAYTGRSGTVHPHLHFEIRTPDHKPINPLLTNLKKIDKTNPVVKSLALVPLSRQSRINFSPEIQTFSAHYISNGNYTVYPKPVATTGNFGVEIKTYDIVNGLYNKYGPYKIEMFVDDSLAFYVQCDSLSFQDSHLITFDRNQQLISKGNGRYIRLWNFLSDNTFPFYKGNFKGNLNLPAGRHKIKIRVSDFNGNTSRLNFSIEQHEQRLPRVEEFNIASDSILVKLNRDSTYNFYQDIKGAWLTPKGSSIRAELNNFQVKSDAYHFSAKRPSATKAFILTAIPVNSSLEQKIYLPCNRAMIKRENINYSFIQNPETFLAKFNFSQIPDSIPELYLHTAQELKKIPLISNSANQFISIPVHYKFWYSAFKMEIRTSSNVILRESIDLTHICARKSTSLVSSDSLFTISFDRESVFRDILVSLKKENKTITNDNIISPIYTVEPFNLNLLKPSEINFKYDSSKTNPVKAGIYGLYHDNLSYLSSEIDLSKRSFQASAGGGSFCLAQDCEPPKIRVITPRNQATYTSTNLTYLKAEVVDELSGIKDDMSIALNLDGKEVIAECNAATDYIRYRIPNLVKGKHKYKITATDKMGNTASKNGIFFIK